MVEEMLIIPSFPELNISFVLNIPVLLVILVLFFIFYSVITSVLVYHWRAYGMKSAGILAAESLFFAVSVILFVTAGVSLFYF